MHKKLSFKNISWLLFFALIAQQGIAQATSSQQQVQNSSKTVQVNDKPDFSTQVGEALPSTGLDQFPPTIKPCISCGAQCTLH